MPEPEQSLSGVHVDSCVTEGGRTILLGLHEGVEVCRAVVPDGVEQKFVSARLRDILRLHRIPERRNGPSQHLHLVT